MRCSALCGILVATLLAGPTIGQEASPPLPLRWADVVHRLDALPELHEAGLRTLAAEAGVDAAGQVPNPEVEATLGRGMPRDNGTGGLEWGLGLTIPLDWLGPRGAQIRAARSEADASRQDAREVRRQVLGRLATLYWKVAFDQHLVATLMETEAQVARLSAMIRLRVEKGEARPTELPRIETEVERVRIDLGRARSESRADLRKLAMVLGLPADPPLKVDADTTESPAPSGQDEARRRVAGSHPRLAAAQARILGRTAEVSAERARRIPSISVGGYFNRELDQDAAGGLVQFRLPVWNWNTGGIRRAEALRMASQQGAETDARDLLAETDATWERCTQGRESAARFDTEILPRAEAASRAVERGFELGEMSLIDVLDARRVLLDVRKERIDSGLRARTDCTALAVLTGEIDDAK
jgi:cobalt-zinc-cadmium efflux system outer membrane protein